MSLLLISGTFGSTSGSFSPAAAALQVSLLLDLADENLAGQSLQKVAVPTHPCRELRPQRACETDVIARPSELINDAEISDEAHKMKPNKNCPIPQQSSLRRKQRQHVVGYALII